MGRGVSERKLGHCIYGDGVWVTVDYGNSERKRSMMRYNYGNCHRYREGSWGGGGEGGWAFPLPPACHHLEILSATYRLLFPTPALTTPLIVWTVEGYLTMCLIS